MELDRPPRNFYRVSPTDEKYRLILTPNNVIDYPPTPRDFRTPNYEKKPHNDAVSLMNGAAWQN